MHSKDGSVTTAGNALKAFAAAFAIFAAFSAISAGKAMQGYARGGIVQIGFGDFDWLGGINFGFASGAQAEELNIVTPPVKIKTVKAAKTVKVVQAVKITKPVEDFVNSAQSAPVEASATEEETGRMRDMHRILRARLITAMNSHDENTTDVTTQLVVAEISRPVTDSFQVADIIMDVPEEIPPPPTEAVAVSEPAPPQVLVAKVHKYRISDRVRTIIQRIKKTEERRRRTSESKNVKKPAKIRMHKKETAKLVPQVQVALETKPELAEVRTVAKIYSDEAGPDAPQVLDLLEDTINTASAAPARLPTGDTHQPPPWDTQPETADPPPEIKKIEAETIPVPARVDDRVVEPVAKDDTSADIQVENINGYSALLNIQNWGQSFGPVPLPKKEWGFAYGPYPKSVNTSGPSQLPRRDWKLPFGPNELPVKAWGVSFGPPLPPPLPPSPEPSPEPEPDPVPSPEPTPLPEPPASCGKAVEAFDWGSEIADWTKQTVSVEGLVGGNQGRWIKSSSDGHIDTISWETGRGGSCKPDVALMTSNTARLIAKFAGDARLHDGEGIVFGRFSPGLAIEFSGRTGHPVFLDGENQQAPSVMAQGGYFAFINIVPGAHLLYVSAAGGLVRTAVPVPVFEGMATYVDVTVPEKHTLSGHIFGGVSKKWSGIEGINIKVVGQAGRLAISGRGGAFGIPDIYSIGDMPMFVEADARQGFPHRYRVNPDAAADLALVWFSEKSVRRWVGQLEGGVSAESGLVVAATPTLVSQYAGTMWPRTMPALKSATLEPETYTLAPDDKLLVKTTLDAERTRFVSVQVPEGANIVSIEDQRGRSLASELIISSPRIINVIGPW